MKPWQDDLVEYLILQGAGEPLEKQQALKIVAAIKSNNLEMLQEAFDEGANPDQKDEAGSPILVIASSKGNEQMVDVLLNAGSRCGSTK